MIQPELTPERGQGSGQSLQLQWPLQSSLLTASVSRQLVADMFFRFAEDKHGWLSRRLHKWGPIRPVPCAVHSAAEVHLATHG